MKCGIGIFAKTVGLSPVKTRLARTIGVDRAEAFFKRCVDCVEETVCQAGQAFPEHLNPVWAIAEETALDQWAGRSFPAIWTGNGELGARLCAVAEKILQTNDAFMLMGTDSPQISPNLLLEAFSRLVSRNHDVVIGPAVDGGFYLFASHVPIARDVWESVPYSQHDTLNLLEAGLKARGIDVHRLRPQQDVDTFADLQTLSKTLRKGETHLSAKQNLLLNWLQRHCQL